MEAMREEMDSMAKNNVWELINLPPWCKCNGNKWFFKIKCHADGSINKFKACLVAKSFAQIKSIDYDEIFPLVVRFTFIRLLLALVTYLDLKLFQMNVKTIFPDGNLEKEIYTN